MDALAGDYTLLTYQPTNENARPLQTALHLEVSPGGTGLVGTDDLEDECYGRTIRLPVASDGDVILIGSGHDSPPGRYTIVEVLPDGFAGTWAHFQPEWLRERQPQTPEWVVGRFTARRSGTTSSR